MAKYSDVQLIQILQKAGRRINRLLCLTGTSEEIIVDGSGEITSPEGESDLEDLVLLQAECMMVQREFINFVSDTTAAGVLVKDGEQTIDTRAAGTARSGAFSSSTSPCEDLKQQIKVEKMNRVGGCGKLVW